MCGRYSLSSTRLTLKQRFELSQLPELDPRFNIAPTQQAPVVRQDSSGHFSLKQMHWGLIPPWAKDQSAAAKLINARAETVQEKASFRKAFQSQRCLVPMDGFYEWRRGTKIKTPYYIQHHKAQILAAAGLWEKWLSPGNELVESFTILTTAANSLMGGIHDRMPIFLDGPHWGTWLNCQSADTEALLPLMVPCPEDLLRLHEVSPAVGKVQNDNASLIEPVGGQGSLF